MGNIQHFVILMLTFVCFGQETVQAQWEQADSIFIQLDDCNEIGQWCLDIPLGDLSNYSITQNGEVYMGDIQGCKIDTFIAMTYFNTFGQGQLGPYFLNSWEVNGEDFSGEFMNITALVDSMNVWDPNGNWEDIPDAYHIRGGNPGSTYSDMNITVIAINLPSIIVSNLSTSTPEGSLFTFERGVYNIGIESTLSGEIQNTVVIVACPRNIEQNSLFELNQTETQCLLASNFGLEGEIVNIQNNCPSNQGIIDFEIVQDCIEATANNYGTESACYEICDEYGFCASLVWNITAQPENSIFEQEVAYTIPVYGEGTHCFDLSQLGMVESVVTLCENLNGTEVVFETLDEATYCINFNGISVGTNSICFNFIDDQGHVLNSTITVDVVPPSTEWIDITLNLGDNTQLCPELTDLSANIVNISNDCENNTSNAVDFLINDISLCTDVEAIAIGVDTACIITCDANSICDTIYYQVTVIDSLSVSPPVANDDSSQTLHNTSVVINICNNDIIPNNSLTDYYILPVSEGGIGPNNGIVVFNNDCTLTYQPNTGICNLEDSLTYVICNEAGCNQAKVEILINCENDTEGLFVNTGLSPNGDGINDYFVIEGIENFPTNTLFIYNRWGNEIYKKERYNNEWQGEWEGDIVADGTYFYLLWNGLGDTMSGYLQVQR